MDGGIEPAATPKCVVRSASSVPSPPAGERWAWPSSSMPLPGSALRPWRLLVWRRPPPRWVTLHVIERNAGWRRGRVPGIGSIVSLFGQHPGARRIDRPIDLADRVVTRSHATTCSAALGGIAQAQLLLPSHHVRRRVALSGRREGPRASRRDGAEDAGQRRRPQPAPRPVSPGCLLDARGITLTPAGGPESESSRSISVLKE